MNATHDPRPDPPSGRPSALARLAALWFGLRAPVDRTTYLVSGLGLMLFKYACEASLLYAWSRRFLSPIVYLSPSLLLRRDALGPEPDDGLHLALALLTLPFLWIGLTMSVRRAVNAGQTPWLGFLFLLPFLNHLVMIVLAVLPSRASPSSRPIRLRRAGRRNEGPANVLAVLVPMALGIAMSLLSIYGLETYGSVLFLSTPCFVGALSAYFEQPRVARFAPAYAGGCRGEPLAAGIGLMLFAVEGLLCLAMAFPIAAVLAACGALIGWMLTARAPSLSAPVSLLVLLLPGSAALERATAVPTLRQVTTMVEIDAPPERVWPHVIGFSEMPPPSDLVFRLGIAYPIRARLDREGVGAVRRCEFSTGAFVEPITAWEPPRRLAFDVIEQPPSMTEWSPYRDIHAPHLEGYMVSQRGEFRLVALPRERTRLEGTTWYTLAIYPESYWVIHADVLLHGIHRRVLSHIKAETEQR